MDTNLGVLMLVVGLIAFVLGAILMSTASNERKTYRAAKDALDEERDELLARATSSKSDGGTSTVELANSVTKLREDLKRAKKKNHEQSKELDDLRAKDKAARDAKPSAEDTASSASAGELHLQLSRAQNENLELQQKLDSLEKQLSSGGRRAVEASAGALEAPEPKKRPKTEASEAPAGESVEELRAYYDSRLSELQSDKDEQVAELRRKLHNSLIATDRERRRADNNDKAYLVTQRELDAARERLGLIEERIRKAAFAAESAQEAEETTATPEVAPHGDPVMDDAEAVAAKSAAQAVPSEEPAGASAADEQWAELVEDVRFDEES